MINSKLNKNDCNIAYPIVIWLIAAIFYFYKFALEVSPSVIGTDLMRFFSLNAVQLGNLGACYFYAYLMMQLPMGVLLDRYGPKRVMTGCILLCALGTLIVATTHVFLVAEIGRFITGLGGSVAAIGCLKLTTLWFPPRKFALMAGLMMSMGMLGAVGGIAPLSLIIDKIGWQHALFYAAFLGSILTIVFWTIVRDHGYYVVPKIIRTEKQNFWHDVIKVLRKSQCWILSIYSGLAFAPIVAFGGLWGVPYLESVYGFSKTAAATAVSTIFIGFAIGAPIGGWLSDRLEKRLPIMAIGTITGFLLLLTIVFYPHLSAKLVSILLFAFGFCLSGFLLSFSLMREINLLVFTATAMGFMNAFNAALGAITDPLLGYVLDASWDGKIVNGVRIFSPHAYQVAISILALYLLIATGLLFFLKDTHCQQQT